MKKKLESDHIENELRGSSAFFSARGESPVSIAHVQRADQKPDHVIKPLSKRLINGVSKGLSKPTKEIGDEVPEELGNVAHNVPVSADAIEDLSFRLRKTSKIKATAEIPVEWKQEIDDLSHELRVGKYDLVMFIIGRFLGRV